jgi:molecular chaperone HscB
VLDLKQNYFSLFALPVSFAIDHEALTDSYRALQRAMHPDRFASGTAQEKRMSMQAASYINEAFRVLGNDLRRANYQLSLQGIDIDAETDTKVDPMFLMTQIEYREQLEKVPECDNPFSAAKALRSALANDVAALKNAVRGQLDGNDLDAARDTVRKWQFLEKLLQELSETEYQLEDALEPGATLHES